MLLIPFIADTADHIEYHRLMAGRDALLADVRVSVQNHGVSSTPERFNAHNEEAEPIRRAETTTTGNTDPDEHGQKS
jgi:hypothetical protein